MKGEIFINNNDNYHFTTILSEIHV